MPLEDGERDSVRLAPLGHIPAGFAVDVNLPDHPFQAGEIVAARHRYPGQAVPAMHLAGNAFAERRVAIIKHDL